MSQKEVKEVNKVTSGATIPVWFKDCPEMPKFPPLSENLDVDICVVGGGIGGLTSAYLLAKKTNKSIALVEAREICSGETGRTTAHLATGIDDHYHTIAKTHGMEITKLVGQAHAAAIDKIEEIVRAEKIDCNFQRIPGYLFLAPEHTKDFLDKEQNACKEIQLATTFTPEVPFPVSTAPRPPALIFPNQGLFHPRKYIAGLTNACAKLGVKIFTNSRVSQFEEGSSGASVTTDANYKVQCKHLVVAANVPINDRFSMYTKMEYYRSYVVTMKVPKKYLENALYWNTSDPYIYVRLQPGMENEDCDYVIVGGEDHKVGQKHDFEERYQRLISWTKRMFPRATDVVSKWSGQIIEPIDDLAFLGRNPGSNPDVYIITGDSGNGMTHTTIGAMLITDMILRKPNDWEKAFNPSRQMHRELTEFLTANINVGVQYKDWITPGDIKDIEELLPGTGGILRKGLHKYAVFKDEKGKVSQCSAVCPHLGCIVSWNQSEKSFDCPCHGSRYGPTGTMINGPSKADLKTEESKL